MKKRIIPTKLTMALAMAMLITTFTLNAQNRRGNGFHGNIPDSAGIVKHVERISAELGLNEDQKAKYLATEQAHFAVVKLKREEANTNRATYRDDMESIRGDHQEDLKKIFTEEQYAKWEELHQQRKRERRHDGSGKGRGQGQGRGQW